MTKHTRVKRSRPVNPAGDPELVLGIIILCVSLPIIAGGFFTWLWL